MSVNGNIRVAYNPDLVVLVVEDHMLFCKDVKHALPGHKVVFARSVEEAKGLYKDTLPDLTFLDIDLPDGNGFELLDFIRAEESDAYVVMLTGSKIEADVAMARKKGAAGYIIKPFARSKIEKQISEYLEFREKKIKMLLNETQKHRSAELLLSRDMIIT